jgi:nitroreductase
MAGTVLGGPCTELSTALRHAAEIATRAPSILNTQPWRWRVRCDQLELSADRARQILSIDPEGRLLTLSCGAALHHARVVLRARGWEADVRRLPDPSRPDLLARIAVLGPYRTQAPDLSLAGCIGHRHSDRRTVVAEAPVGPRRMESLSTAAAGEGVGLHKVTESQRAFVTIAARRARAAEAADDAYLRDLAAWTDGRAHGEGVPRETMVADDVRPPGLRDFARGGGAGVFSEGGDDAMADFLILWTDGDGPRDWLRAGEATSAVWLTGTVNQVTMSVLSDVVEVASARTLLQRLLPSRGHPQIVLRIGLAAHPAPAPASPRRRVDTMIEVD